MRYNLGLMDMYPIEAAGSCIENNPMYRVIFKDVIDPIMLEDAFRKAIKIYPLFGTRVKYKNDYYLEDNDKPLKLIHSNEENRPLVFGKNTNDYPWQCCYFENKLTFEWLHGVSDGVGAMNFLKQVLCFYCGAEYIINDKKYLVAPGLEPFFDSKEKGINFKEDPTGFSFNDFPVYKKRGYKTDSHVLKAKTSEILVCAKNNESSVAPIISILFSMALRKHLPEKSKNKNVACNIVLDLRRPLNYETMHNCVEYKRVTYQDKHEKMSFREVAKEYKSILDDARIVQNVVKIITDRVVLFRAYHIFKTKRVRKAVLKLLGKILKHIDCNFVLTYLGKVDFPKEVLDKVEDIQFRVWHDFGECIIACMDYNGMFTLNISENFIEKGVVEDFIEISKQYGIDFECVEESEFEQAHFSED